MQKRQKNLKPKVLFNASVILSGLNSPKGGSAKVLFWTKTGKIEGIVSEIIFNEVLRHAIKFNISEDTLSKKTLTIFKKITNAPSKKDVDLYKRKVIDPGDAHVLASAKKEKVKYLVTLDKKHLLVLKGKIKGLKIITPGELIQLLS